LLLASHTLYLMVMTQIISFHNILVYKFNTTITIQFFFLKDFLFPNISWQYGMNVFDIGSCSPWKREVFNLLLLQGIQSTVLNSFSLCLEAWIMTYQRLLYLSLMLFFWEGCSLLSIQSCTHG
jgi:hypothetical protein